MCALNSEAHSLYNDFFLFGALMIHTVQVTFVVFMSSSLGCALRIDSKFLLPKSKSIKQRTTKPTSTSDIQVCVCPLAAANISGVALAFDMLSDLLRSALYLASISTTFCAENGEAR